MKDDIANKVRRLNSEIWDLLREFLGLEIYQSDFLLKEKHIFEGFAELDPKGGHRDFLFSSMESKISDSKISSSQLALRHQIWADQLSGFHISNFTSITSTFEKTVDALDEYYFTERIFYELESLTLSTQYSQLPDIPPFEILLTLFKDKIPTFNPLARGGYYLFLAYHEPENPEHLDNMFSLIETHESEIEKTPLRNLTTGALNLLIQLNNQDRKKYMPRLLEGYLFILEKGWICIENCLEVRHFNNVITLLLQHGKIVQAEKIYFEWESNLLTNSPDFAQNFNLGKILLEKY
ncbi:MAG: hypothetical protein R3B93_08940 [Bacteroidia bacterium]